MQTGVVVQWRRLGWCGGGGRGGVVEEGGVVWCLYHAFVCGASVVRCKRK